MKRVIAWRNWVSVVVAGLLLQGIALAQGGGADVAGPQVWRANGGHSITAEFIEIKAGVVVLKGADGALRQVPMHLLIPEDQARAKTLDEQKRTAPAHAVAKGAVEKLPVFSEGPGKGFFAVYTHENFVAKLGPDAVLRVQCLENGAAVGNPIPVYLWNFMKDPTKGLEQRRPIVSFNSAYTPIIQPDRMLFEGMLADGVQFGVGFEFKGNTIQIWGWAEDPKEIKLPTASFPVCGFVRTHTFPADLLVVEQKKIVEPFSLKVEPRKGKTIIYPYGDRVKGFNQPSKSVEVMGPVFGGRKVSLTLGSSKACDLRPWSRGGEPPFEGFEVRLLKEDTKSRNENIRMILTID